MYTKKILAKFKIRSDNVVNIILLLYFKLFVVMCYTNIIENNIMSNVSYNNTIGNLIYLMVCIKPDIAHTIGLINMYIANFGKYALKSNQIDISIYTIYF